MELHTIWAGLRYACSDSLSLRSTRIAVADRTLACTTSPIDATQWSPQTFARRSMQPVWVRWAFIHALPRRVPQPLDQTRSETSTIDLEAYHLSHRKPQLNHRQINILAPLRRSTGILVDLIRHAHRKLECSNSSIPTPLQLKIYLKPTAKCPKLNLTCLSLESRFSTTNLLGHILMLILRTLSLACYLKKFFCWFRTAWFSTTWLAGISFLRNVNILNLAKLGVLTKDNSSKWRQ